MKKLSLLSIFGLTVLLAFFATPIYAQEEDVNLEEENLVATVEDVVADVEDVVVDAVNEIEVMNEELSDGLENLALEITDEPAIEGEVDLDENEGVSDIFNFNEEEFTNTFGSLNDDQKGVVALTGLTGLFASLGIATWVVGLIWIVLIIIALWKIFERAGEPGWKAIIPIYNVYILYKIVGMKSWFWYSLLVPFLLGLIAVFLPESMESMLGFAGTLFSVIVAIVAAFKLPRKFGWNVFTSILYVLFTSICILVLGFGNYKFEGKSEEA